MYRVLFVITVIFIGFYVQESYAEIIEYGLGPVTDLIAESDSIYFFESDRTIQSPTWIPDTQIMYSNGEQKTTLSEKLFIYPTELIRKEDDLFFAVLSDTCAGQVACDFQDIIKISTKDGSTNMLAAGLKSAIHLSVDEDKLYISESNGKIWKMNLDGSNMELVFSGNNIIMDVAAHNGIIYWIEEINSEESRLMQIDKSNKPIIVDGRLHIPYELKITFDKPTWNDISVKPAGGSINDFTTIKILENDDVIEVAEFKNTSPVAMSQSDPHYKPYFVYGDYIVLANNTSNPPVVQLLNYKDDAIFDLATIEGYEIKYFRSDHQHLYIIGQNEDGFVIERLAYPVTVPEFGPVLIILMVSLFAGIVLSRRLLPSVRLG